MKVEALKPKLESKRFPTNVLSVFNGVMGVFLFVRASWHYQQLHAYALVLAVVFLVLIGVAFYRVRRATNANDQNLKAIQREQQWVTFGVMLVAVGAIFITHR